MTRKFKGEIMKVLFTGCTFDEKTITDLKSKNIEVLCGRMDYTEDELSEQLKKVDCYINGGDEICTKKVIEENKHLKLISFMGTGYQNILMFLQQKNMVFQFHTLLALMQKQLLNIQ